MEYEYKSINKKLERDTAVFYSCGICNLNCAYCCIDKNPALRIIDDKLEESFQDDYYFKRVKEYFPNRGQLRRIETWGGEPFLKMERMHNLIHQLISYYPYFDTMFSSTNFSFDSWADKFFDLISIFGEYPFRTFNFELQLSIDGPEYINDINRGKGTTKKCLENFQLFVDRLSELPSNVILNIFTKGTLDNHSISLLDSKEKIIEYYQFLEEHFIDKIKKLNKENIIMQSCVPNTAVPSPVTKEIGLQFAKICKWCKEIEQENRDTGYFKYYWQITPFSNNDATNFPSLSYYSPQHTCGSGKNMLGFLPDDVVASCHESFIHLVEQYKKDFSESKGAEKKTISFEKYISNKDCCKYCLSDEGYQSHELQMSYFEHPKTTFRLSNMVIQIVTLALAGQIDKKYSEESVALEAAKKISDRTAFCIKNNYNITGSFIIIPNGILKLLLNGALDYICEDIND